MESLKTILYFSIFRYPLSLEEIHEYTNNEQISETEKELEYFVNLKILTKVQNFYIYANDLESVTKRLNGNINALKAYMTAKEKAKFIAQFPFVKAVGITGSLSKGYYDNHSDIDFFVITSSNKLWICRTILMVFKKIFYLNSKKKFCINYFITSNHLEIDEKNRFTATELKTLIPFQGITIFEQFYQSNEWVKIYFPKFKANLQNATDTKKSIFISFFEKLLENNLGLYLDKLFKKKTLIHWLKKFNHLSTEDFKVAFKSNQNVSKHHPSNFQKKVLMQLNSKIDEVEKMYQIVIEKENV